MNKPADRMSKETYFKIASDAQDETLKRLHDADEPDVVLGGIITGAFKYMIDELDAEYGMSMLDTIERRIDEIRVYIAIRSCSGGSTNA